MKEVGHQTNVSTCSTIQVTHESISVSCIYYKLARSQANYILCELTYMKLESKIVADRSPA